MGNYLKLFLYVIGILLLSSFSVAEEDGSMSFRSVAACPPDVTIRTMLADSRGFIWFGSDNYVYRFDGVHMVPYSLLAEDSDKIVLVRDMAETPDGKIIVSTDSGLFCLEATPEGTTSAKPFMRDKISEASGLCPHPDGYLLIATPSALWSYSFLRGTASRILINRDPLSPTNIPQALTPAPGGVEIVAADGGIYLIEKNFRTSCVRKPASDFPQATKAIHTDSAVYLATETAGLWRIDNAGRASRVKDVEGNVVTSVEIRGDSTLFVGTDGDGLYILSLPQGVVSRHLMHRPGEGGSLQSNQIYSLLTDRENRLWVGHYQRGVDHTEVMSPGIAFTTVNRDDRAVRTINILPNRNILVGTRLGMYFLSPDGEKVLKHVMRPALRSNMVISAAVVGDTVYAGTYGGGLSMFDASTGSLLPGPGPLPGNMDAAHVFSICREPASGAIWFGTSHGLFRTAGGNLTRFTSENSALTKGNVYTVFFDSSGKGWIGTEEGLTIWDPAMKKLRTDCFPEDFVSKAKVRQIYEGKEHTLYFVLENGRIALSNLDMSEFSRPAIFDGRSFVIKAVAEDRFGFVWLAASHGLIRWDRLSRFTVFGRDNGLPSTLFIHCIPAKDNPMILFGNAGGMLTINTDLLSKTISQSPLVPVLAEAEGNPSVDNFIESAFGEYEVNFGVYSKDVKLRISTMHFAESDNSKYEYRVGDGEWLPMPPGYVVSLHNIDHGSTEIQFRPVNDDRGVTKVVVRMPSVARGWIWVSAGIVAAACVAWMLARKIRIKKEEESGYEAPPATGEEENPETEGDEGDEGDGLSGARSKYASIVMSAEECEAVMEKVCSILEKDKPYTNPDLKLADLAKMAHVSSHRLSYVLSQHSNIGFYDLINRYRIDEFKRIVDSGANQTLTLTAMSERAGFSSRSSFFRCFKKLEGITPGEYLKRKS